MVAVKKTPKRVRNVRIRYVREHEFSIPANELPRPVKRHRTHPAIMGCGGKDKPNCVIDDGRIMEYVGIGWVCIKELADAADYRKFPRVID